MRPEPLFFAYALACKGGCVVKWGWFPSCKFRKGMLMKARLFLAAAIAVFATAVDALADIYTGVDSNGVEWRYKIEAEVRDGKLVSAYATLGGGSTTVPALAPGTGGPVVVPASLPAPDGWANVLVRVERVDPASIPASLPVKALNKYAFRNMADITSVSFQAASEDAPVQLLPGDMYATFQIGNYAFFGCTGLQDVSLAPGVFFKTPDGAAVPGTINIGVSAFFGCTGLTKLDLGNHVGVIGDSAFRECTGLTELDLGRSVSEIGDSAFRGCVALEAADIPHSVAILDSNAFAGSGIKSVHVRSPEVAMDEDVFASCPNLVEARIPYTFYREDALEVYELYFNGSTGLLVEVDVGKVRANIRYFNLATFDAGILDDIVVQESWPEPRQRCRTVSDTPAECYLEIDRWTENGKPEGTESQRALTFREAIEQNGFDDSDGNHYAFPGGLPDDWPFMLLQPHLREDGGFLEWDDWSVAAADRDGHFAGWSESRYGDVVYADPGVTRPGNGKTLYFDLDRQPQGDETYYARWHCTIETTVAGENVVRDENCWAYPALNKVFSGAVQTISAAPGEELFFAGWYDQSGEPLVCGDDYRNPNKTFTANKLSATFEARFAGVDVHDEPHLKLAGFDLATYREPILHPDSPVAPGTAFFVSHCTEKEVYGTCECETEKAWCCCNPEPRKFIFWKDTSRKYTDEESEYVDSQTSAKICTVLKIDSLSLPSLSVKAKSLPKGFSLESGTHGENGYVLKGTASAPGCRRLEFTLKNSYMTAVESVWLRFPNWTNEVFTAAGLQDVYKLAGGEGEWDFHPVAYPIQGAGWKLTVADLPPGMKYNASKCTIDGTPKESGIYTPVFTAKRGSETIKASCTVIVQMPVLTIVKAGAGTISGEDKNGEYSKEFHPGAKVTLTAKAAKGWAFTGWYDAHGNKANRAGIPGFGVDWRLESVSFQMPATSLDLTAAFARTVNLVFPPAAIKTIPDQTLTQDGAFEDGTFDLGEYIDSDAFPKTTLTGLPPGIAFDAKTLVLSGVCKKPGVYTVTVTSSVSWTKELYIRKFKIFVPNIRWGVESMPLDFEDSYFLAGGLPPPLNNEFSALDFAGWKMTLSGLPSGVKYDAKKKMLTGVATKEGFYTVTFTAKRGKETRVCTSTFIVDFLDLTLEVAELNLGSGASGKATGGGSYPSGKKVTLKAVPDKKCVFAGWFDEDDELVSQLASWQFVTEPNDRTFTAKFATLEEDAESIALYTQLPELNMMEIPKDLLEEPFDITLTCGVFVRYEFRPQAITPATLSVTGLPSGLKMSFDKDSGMYIVSGAPQAASKKDKNGNYIPSKTVFTVTTGAKSKAQYMFNVTVEPLPAWAVGAFEGTVSGCYDSILIRNVEPPDHHWTVGPLASLSVTENGKISCKFPPVVSREADIPSMSASSFDSYDSVGEVLTAKFEGKLNGSPVTYDVTIKRAEPVGGVESGIAQVDYFKDVIGLGGMHYGLDSWTGRKNVWGEDEWKPLAAKFAKLKSMKLELPGTDGSTPLEVKFLAGGKAMVKYGRISASTVLFPVKDGDSILYAIPVFLYFGYDSDPVSRGVVIYLEWTDEEGFELYEIVDTFEP